MLTLSQRHQVTIGVMLVTLLIATRGHHFATAQSLPSASWAVFFLAGVYLRSIWVFPGLISLAAFLDYAAITWGGVSSFCVSPAYVALLPAYGTLWFAGRWFTNRYSFDLGALLSLSMSILIGTIVCELISSGSFYFFSGRFSEPTLAEFSNRLVQYFPLSLSSIMFWISVATIIHVIAVKLRNTLIKSAEI